MPPADALTFAGRVLHDAQPATGGYSGETFAGMWLRRRAYVRLYLRDPARAQVDLALMRRLEGALPLAAVLSAMTAPPTSAAGLPAHLVTAAVPGRRGDTLLDAAASVPAARALGRSAARVVNALRAQRFDVPGPLLDAGLRVGRWPAALGSLTLFAAHLGPGLTAAGFDVSRRSPLHGALVAADGRLAGGVPQPPSLVHGDLNAKNLVVHPDTGQLQAVLDWEHAHSGSWLTDVGNLLRGLDRPGATPSALAFRQGLVDSMHEILLADRLTNPAAPTPPDWVASAADHDLFAVLDLAARPATGPVPPPVSVAREVLRELPRLLPRPALDLPR